MAAEYKKDLMGLVTIKKGQDTAKVMPESIKVWEALGWKVDTADEKVSNTLEVPTVEGDKTITVK